jgi:hypothetical protein
VRKNDADLRDSKSGTVSPMSVMILLGHISELG